VLSLRRVLQALRKIAACSPKARPFPHGSVLAVLRCCAQALRLKRIHMPNRSIRMESGFWLREQPNERDPLREFPELFNAKGTGRGVVAANVGSAPEFEVKETTDGFSLRACVPGITAAELQIRVTAQLVIVMRKQGGGAEGTAAGELNSAPSHPAFRRAFVLPSAVDARRLKVTIVSDVLTLNLPKRVPVQAKLTARTTRGT